MAPSTAYLVPKKEERTCRSRSLEWLVSLQMFTWEHHQVTSGSDDPSFLYWLCVLSAELFRKATKRQVMLGAALVDEKGNLRPDAATNTASLIMPSMLVPPPHRFFQFHRAEYHHVKRTGGVCHLGQVAWGTPLLRNLFSQPVMVDHVFPGKRLKRAV